jgi:hypothetical protein
MSTVEEVESAVQGFSDTELASFRAWFAAFDAELWDSQFRDDVKNGRLDRLADEALGENRAGRTTDL